MSHRDVEHLGRIDGADAVSIFSRRPPWPPRPLLDLAAGIDPGPFDLTPQLVAIALDHRMGGLLWSWARDHAQEGDLRSAVAVRDLRTQAHSARVWGLLESCVQRLSEVGIEVASIKGPTTEARWYSRPGERPTSDVDLWLSPYQIDRAGDALATLQPDHPWAPVFGDLAADGVVQTVTLKVDDIEVDLHIDLFKTGLRTLQAPAIWDATRHFELPGGTMVPVLDSAAALFHFLIHLNKDRFQRLLGYADIVRIVDSEIDWDRLIALATGEGLATPAFAALEVVYSDVGLPLPSNAPASSGPRSWLWRLIWTRRVRLRGMEGRRQFRRRQLLIPALADRSVTEVAAVYALEVAPPEPVLRLSATVSGGWASRLRTWVATVLDRRRMA